MRLWHEDLIGRLPRAQLLGQHRECAALRGGGWGKKHSVVDYVFEESPFKLYLYHMRVIKEMEARGYKPDPKWKDPLYRGKSQEAYEVLEEVPLSLPIYKAHDSAYLGECLENLEAKGISLGSKE